MITSFLTIVSSLLQDAQIVSESGPSQPVPVPPSSEATPAPTAPDAQAAPQPGASNAGASIPPPPAPGPTADMGAVPPNINPLMIMLMRDPQLAPKLQNPRVQKALEEISRSPWKTVCLVLDMYCCRAILETWLVDRVQLSRACSKDEHLVTYVQYCTTNHLICCQMPDAGHALGVPICISASSCKW